MEYSVLKISCPNCNRQTTILSPLSVDELEYVVFCPLCGEEIVLIEKMKEKDSVVIRTTERQILRFRKIKKGEFKMKIIDFTGLVHEFEEILTENDHIEGVLWCDDATYLELLKRSPIYNDLECLELNDLIDNENYYATAYAEFPVYGTPCITLCVTSDDYSLDVSYNIQLKKQEIDTLTKDLKRVLKYQCDMTYEQAVLEAIGAEDKVLITQIGGGTYEWVEYNPDGNDCEGEFVQRILDLDFVAKTLAKAQNDKDKFLDLVYEESKTYIFVPGTNEYQACFNEFVYRKSNFMNEFVFKTSEEIFNFFSKEMKMADERYYVMDDFAN